MRRKFISLVYILSSLLFLAGVVLKFIPFYEINPDLLVCIAILLPKIFDYNSIVNRGMIEMCLNFLILLSGFLILYDFSIGLFSFLLIQSILYAKQGGLILKKITPKALS